MRVNAGLNETYANTRTKSELCRFDHVDFVQICIGFINASINVHEAMLLIFSATHRANF